MGLEWSDFWNSFLDNYKLNGKVREIDSFSKSPIEDICHKIYDDYDYDKLTIIRRELIREVENFPGVHLNTSRVKGIESLLEKVITKKYKWMMNPDNRYSNISSDNYDKIITDLIGIRFILSYSGDWKALHDQIVRRFPYMNDEEYLDDRLIPLRKDKEFIAEIPMVYYAYGDDLSIFEGEKVKKSIKPSGYRSIHYVICFKGVYVEIQVRTIYDEAWSDCNHNYVYKHEDNASYSVLLELSDILSQYTNTCSELGELMRSIYNDNSIVEKDKKFIATNDTFLRISHLFDRYSKAQNLITQFKENLCVKGDESDE
ncbi:ppGpp synthetase catalytic domain-containing protein (RelA/SpoT-type nucleotidyltranferase) [Eubacterium ruminantium]|nr:ppGpp synthetase catalytic domain-containing protein (RelA/SpoT-type nucleotidyltranferase) [Eubacterium ruminantium]